jgi:hypothetical protein
MPRSGTADHGIPAREYTDTSNVTTRNEEFHLSGTCGNGHNDPYGSWHLGTLRLQHIKACSHRFLHGNLVKGVHAVLHSFRDHAKLVRTHPAQQEGLKGRAPRENKI